MGKHKRLTSIEILLILAIIVVLVVWLFPRFLKILDSQFSTIGTVKPHIREASGTGSSNKYIIAPVNKYDGEVLSLKLG
jgi:hypothetical protein